MERGTYAPPSLFYFTPWEDRPETENIYEDSSNDKQDRQRFIDMTDQCMAEGIKLDRQPGRPDPKKRGTKKQGAPKGVPFILNDLPFPDDNDNV